MLGLFRRTQSRAPAMAARTFGAADPALRARLEAELASEDAVLRVAAPTITTLWLNDAIRRGLAPLRNWPIPMASRSSSSRCTTGSPRRPRRRASPRRSPGSRPPRRRGRLALDLVRAREKPPRKGRRRKGDDDPDTGRTIHGNLILKRRFWRPRSIPRRGRAHCAACWRPALAGWCASRWPSG